MELSLLVHPQWLAGEAKQDANGQPYGGSAQDDVAATTRWDAERAANIRLLEVRGVLPDEVTDPDTGISFAPKKGTVPKKSHYACSACGTVQDVLTTIKATGKTGPMAAYAMQGYAPKRDAAGKPYGGRFFAAYDATHAQQYDTAFEEWEERKDADLKDYWPRSELPLRLHDASPARRCTKSRLHSLVDDVPPTPVAGSRATAQGYLERRNYDWSVREFVLGSFQNYLRNQSVLCLLAHQQGSPRSCDVE